MSCRINRSVIAALALLGLSACSVLFDPAQYRAGSDAAAGGADAPAIDMDGAATEASVPDAVTPDLDAPLDALDPVDAPRAPMCPGPTSLVLPTCSTGTNGLAYCSPVTGRTESLSAATASALLPGGGRYELGLLGNAVEIHAAPPSSIHDHELVREGDDLAVLWAEPNSDPAVIVSRARFAVGPSGLVPMSATPDTVTLADAVGEADVSLEPGVIDSASVAYEDTGGTWRVRNCAGFMGCVAGDLVPSARPMGPVWAANAGSAVFAAYRSATTFEVERVRPSSLTGNVGGTLPTLMGVRSTSGRVFYTSGPRTATQYAFEATTTAVLFTDLGVDLPRLSPFGPDAMGRDAYMLARAIPSPGRTGAIDVMAGTLFAGEAGFDCGSSCSGPLGFERTIDVGLPTLVDWSLDVADRIRVATFLVGDSGGTNVLVALWDPTLPDATPITPLVIGSGRVSPATPGVGRSIRTVTTYTESRIEVFVSTLVQHAGMDRIFLAGLRLERCGS